MSATRYRFDEGGIFPLHSHQQEQITYVVRGHLTFEIDGLSHRVFPGDVVVIPPGFPTRHWQAGRCRCRQFRVSGPDRLRRDRHDPGLGCQLTRLVRWTVARREA